MTTLRASFMETLLSQWRHERPDIDPLPMAVVGEIWRAGKKLGKALWRTGQTLPGPM